MQEYDIPKNGLVALDGELVKKWDVVCEKSEYPNPFMRDSFLSISLPQAKRYFWYEKSLIRAALVVPSSPATLEVPTFSIFHSLSLISQGTYNKPIRGVSDKNALLQRILDELTKKHSDFDLSLSPDFLDIRPLQWHNYESSSGVFSITPRYTAVKNLKSISSEGDLVNSFNVHRRRIINKIDDSGLRFTDSINLESFIQLYRTTFIRQNITPSLQTLEKVRQLLSSIQNQNGMLLGAVDSDGVLLSGIAILMSRNTAYSLFIVNSDVGRDNGVGTWLMAKTLEFGKRIGLEYFDFVGANTLGRGNFKLSFGADLQLYFEASYRSPLGL